MNDMNIKEELQTVLSRSYLVFIPERTARAGAALTVGLVYEASEVVLPVAVRRSRLYQAIVGQLGRNGLPDPVVHRVARCARKHGS